jgi:hypothetical protein
MLAYVSRMLQGAEARRLHTGDTLKEVTQKVYALARVLNLLVDVL